jgi:hypothetical protein
MYHNVSVSFLLVPLSTWPSLRLPNLRRRLTRWQHVLKGRLHVNDFLYGGNYIQGCQIFKPKIQIWVNFGGSCNERCWYILWTLGLFCGLLVYLMDIWYSSWYFGYIFSRFGILYKEISGNPDYIDSLLIGSRIERCRQKTLTMTSFLE